jgi:hypothetical protein
LDCSTLEKVTCWIVLQVHIIKWKLCVVKLGKEVGRIADRVVSKRDPSIEASTAVIGDTCYAVTSNKDSIDIVNVNVNTSHSIEKYPEVITI